MVLLCLELLIRRSFFALQLNSLKEFTSILTNQAHTLFRGLSISTVPRLTHQGSRYVYFQISRH